MLTTYFSLRFWMEIFHCSNSEIIIINECTRWKRKLHIFSFIDDMMCIELDDLFFFFFLFIITLLEGYGLFPELLIFLEWKEKNSPNEIQGFFSAMGFSLRFFHLVAYEFTKRKKKMLNVSKNWTWHSTWGIFDCQPSTWMILWLFFLLSAFGRRYGIT